MAKKKKKPNSQLPETIKDDDGTRYIIVDSEGHQVYPGKGLPLVRAQELADRLIEKGHLKQV